MDRCAPSRSVPKHSVPSVRGTDRFGTYNPVVHSGGRYQNDPYRNKIVPAGTFVHHFYMHTPTSFWLWHRTDGILHVSVILAKIAKCCQLKRVLMWGTRLFDTTLEKSWFKLVKFAHTVILMKIPRTSLPIWGCATWLGGLICFWQGWFGVDGVGTLDLQCYGAAIFSWS